MLASGGRGDRSIAMVHDMVNAEMLERRVRSAVFFPIVPHCAPVGAHPGRMSFPPQSLRLAWRAVKEVHPELVDLAMRSAVTLRPDDEAPPEFNEICLRVAEGVRNGAGGFGPLKTLLDQHKDGHAERFAQALSLAPIVRSTLPKLPIWARTLSNEFAAAIRLAFRDSTAIRDDAGPAFMEMVYGHLEEPWQVLRLISLVMDRPSDRYLASSELASFGVRLLDDIDRRIDGLKRFESDRGLEAGVELAASIHTATILINEFDQWLAISREGPWGTRLSAQKRSLALAAEARLREVEAAVNAALPVQPTRFAARSVRGMPNLGREVEPRVVFRAQALLAFLYETRTFASYGGFGSVRTKIVEALDPRIDQYAEDLLEMLHSGEGEAERIREALEITADFLGLVRDPKAADIVRRRTAVA